MALSKRVVNLKGLKIGKKKNFFGAGSLYTAKNLFIAMPIYLVTSYALLMVLSTTTYDVYGPLEFQE